MPMRRKKRKQPAWDLYRDGISYSLLSRFINCRERFRIYAVEGLTPADTSDSLEFGTLFHKLLEYHAKGYTLPQLERLLSKDGVSTSFLGRLALEIFRIYVDTWKDQDASIRYVSQEEVFRTTVWLPSGRKVDLRGKFDEVFRDQGKLWLQENKTKSQIDEVSLEHTLPFDLQTMLYCHSIRAIYKEAPSGVLYNVIRKPGLKQKVKETDSDFLKRITADISSRPEWYYVRYRISFGPNDIDNFAKQTLFPLLEQVCLWWESIKANPFQPWTQQDGSTNPHHYSRPFGVYDSFRNGRGEYFDLITRGVDHGLALIDTVFPELTPEENASNLVP